MQLKLHIFFCLLFCEYTTLPYTQTAYSDPLHDLDISEEYSFSKDINSCHNQIECRNLIKKYGKLNTHISSYYDARVAMFQEVDAWRGKYGDWYVWGVYSREIIILPYSGLPDSEIANTEHTFPQSSLRDGANYSKSKADLYHLFPTISSTNLKRGNLPFSECDGNGKEWKICPKGFEPPDSHKGVAARAMFYISIVYDLEIEQYQEKTLRSWSKKFPVVGEERYRARKIYEIQGNRNPFIDHPEWIDIIKNF